MQTLGYDELSLMLGVSHPLLMLDRLDVDAASGCAHGLKAVSADEVQFTGHFPGKPVLPGVLQATGMVQAAQALLVAGGARGPVAVTALKRIKFRQPVFPGMMLHVECKRGAPSADGAVDFSAKILSGGQVVSSGTVTLAAVDESWYAAKEPAAAAEDIGEAYGDCVRVCEVMPHRYPFLFLDGVMSLDMAAGARGFKNVSGSGLYVNASRPAHFPGLFQIEALAQLGCAAVLSKPENRGNYGYFVSIDSARFHGAALPGDRLDLSLTCEMLGHGGFAEGAVRVGGRLLTEAAIKFAILPPDDAEGDRKENSNEAFLIQKS